MADRPSHTAYVVEKVPQSSDRKAFWREVGGAWPHKDGGGYDLVLYDQLSVSGRIVLRLRDDDAPETGEAPHE